MIERHMRIPVARWMMARSMTPVMEMYCMSNCDMVGVRWSGRKMETVIAVELKLTLAAAVLRQCKAHTQKAHEVWAAMMTCSKKQQAKFADAGVGLLLMDGYAVREVVQPRTNKPFEGASFGWEEQIRRNCWKRRDEYKERMQDAEMRKPLFTGWASFDSQWGQHI